MFDIEWTGAMATTGILVFGVLIGAVVFDGGYSPGLSGSSMTIGEYTGGTQYNLKLHGFGIIGHKVSVTAENGECYYGRDAVIALAFYDREYNIIWATTFVYATKDYVTDSSVETIVGGSCSDGNVKELIIKMREKPVRVSFSPNGVYGNNIEYRTF